MLRGHLAHPAALSVYATPAAQPAWRGPRPTPLCLTPAGFSSATRPAQQNGGALLLRPSAPSLASSFRRAFGQQLQPTQFQAKLSTSLADTAASAAATGEAPGAPPHTNAVHAPQNAPSGRAPRALRLRLWPACITRKTRRQKEARWHAGAKSCTARTNRAPVSCALCPVAYALCPAGEAAAATLLTLTPYHSLLGGVILGVAIIAKLVLNGRILGVAGALKGM